MKKNLSLIVVFLPPPAEGEVDDLPRFLDAVESIEGFPEDRPVLCPVGRFAERVTEGPAQVHGPRRLYLFGVAADD